MTLISPRKVKCAICGHEQTVRVLCSTNSFGYMDLDTRPAGMARSTHSFAVTQCENCGYAYSDISKSASNQVEEWMKSDEYRAMLCDFHVGASRRFLCAAFINDKMNRHDIAGRYYLYAAWNFDDGGLKEYAVMSRESAIEQFDLFREQTDDIDYAVLTVDLKRRISDFDGAKQTAEELLTIVDDKFLQDVLRYQIRLCNSKDDLCHNVGEVADKKD